MAAEPSRRVFLAAEPPPIDTRNLVDPGKALLRELLEAQARPRLHFVDHVAGEGPEVWANAHTFNVEGIDQRGAAGRRRLGRTDHCLGEAFATR